MKSGTAITIVKSSNGFIIFEQNNPELPTDASLISGFTELTQSYHSRESVVEFIKDHFDPSNTAEPTPID